MATLKQIAEQAKAGVSTVSYVLTGKAEQMHISPALAERIRTIANTLNYRPNAAARSVRRGRSNNVALVGRSDMAIWHINKVLIEGCFLAAEKRGMHLLVARLPDGQLTDARFMPGILRELTADGLLIAYDQRVPASMVSLLRRFSIPAAWINVRMKRDCFSPDEEAAGRLATEILLQAGHRRILFVFPTHPPYDPEAHHFSVMARYEGHVTAMRGAGLSPQPPWFSTLKEVDHAELQFARLRALLASPERPSAIFGYSQVCCRSAAEAALGLGLRIPEDLSLICVESADQPPIICGRPLSRVITPHHEMAEAALALLLRKLEDPTVRQAAMIIPCGSLVGDSVVAPAAAR